MALKREDNLAWELVDQYRDLLTPDELTAAFVGLGVGDYAAVIRHVLTAIVGQRKPLAHGTAADVQAWIDCYDQHVEFATLLSRASGIAPGATAI